MPYALFKNGRRVSKWHDTRLAAVIEAYEAKAVISIPSDFGPYQVHNQLAEGYEIGTQLACKDADQTPQDAPTCQPVTD